MRKLSVASLVLALLLPAAAHAFCGFYVGGAGAKLFNNATLVVLMRDGARTVLSMQNNYEGPPEGFAMVVPVPVVLQKENVKTLPHEIFDKVEQLAAPRLVEYWEQDPCRPQYDDDDVRMAPMTMKSTDEPRRPTEDLGVKVEAKFTVGEYQIVILSAKDSSGLDTWLRREGYAIPEGAAEVLRPYVQAGSKFFVAKVDVKKVKVEHGHLTLSPLRFHYDSDTFNLPVRLGLLSSPGTQDLIVNVLARGQRYEVANYPNVTIPTNIDVAETARKDFGAFYAALFDATLERNKQAVITEYAWDASSCDPCPIPALDESELATLGADALPGGRQGRGGGFVLTRLHARYAKESLGQDLVFRAAPPIMGGREVRSEKGLEHGARSAGTNNFQARYAIRHPWKGPIACKNPRRGMWGGPPNGGQPQPSSATDLAFAKRGAVTLQSIIRSDVPELGLKAK